MHPDSSPPHPTSSAGSRVGPRLLPIPNAFGRHITNATSPCSTFCADPSSLGSASSNTTDGDLEDLRTISTQQDIIKDLKLQIFRYQAQNKLSAGHIKMLESENQQLHQDLLWRESMLERLEGSLDIGEVFAERNGMVEIISKTLGAELALARQYAKKLEEKSDKSVGNCKDWLLSKDA